MHFSKGKGRTLDPPADGHVRPDLENAKSQVGGKSQEIVVMNWRTEPCRILWVDFQGVERSYFTLEAGQTRQSSSFVGHVWVARDVLTDDILEAWIVEDGSVNDEGEVLQSPVVQLLAVYPEDEPE